MKVYYQIFILVVVISVLIFGEGEVQLSYSKNISSVIIFYLIGIIFILSYFLEKKIRLFEYVMRFSKFMHGTESRNMALFYGGLFIFAGSFILMKLLQ